MADVSIRARHHWRAILTLIRPRCTSGEFQSAPAITGGRSAHGPQGVPGPVQFQSAPAITGGRSNGHHARLIARRCFNPRPPSLAGDPLSLTGPLTRAYVSIRARHHWRAIPRRTCSRASPFQFQSAPAITGGRSLADAGWWGTKAVFQSAPAITGGRSARRARRNCARRMFQSAPAITGGRSNIRWLQGRRVICFNPRPPSLAGDPPTGCALISPAPVSIRARHHWRAIPAVSK